MHSNIQLSSATQILLSFSHLILSTWREKFLSINYLRRGISKTHGYHFYMKSIVIIINHIILFFFIARSYKGWRWVEIISSLPSISKTFFSFFSVQKNMRARSFLLTTITMRLYKMFLYQKIMSDSEMAFNG